jgi:hypothetical protein
MVMVEVFKTNISSELLANEVLKKLNLLVPSAMINFDLNDCDRILRVQSEANITECVLAFFEKSGLFCEVLNDEPII